VYFEGIGQGCSASAEQRTSEQLSFLNPYLALYSAYVRCCFVYFRSKKELKFASIAEKELKVASFGRDTRSGFCFISAKEIQGVDVASSGRRDMKFQSFREEY
jgi:hypothetical protein